MDCTIFDSKMIEKKKEFQQLLFALFSHLPLLAAAAVVAAAKQHITILKVMQKNLE